MIRIIKQGTKQTTTCETCGCFFSFEKEDLVIKNLDSVVESYTDWKEFVNCPQCSCEVIIRQTR